MGCVFCGAVARTKRISNYKHDWFQCAACETMWRQRKPSYPFDGLIRLMSKNWLTNKIANRLFPSFMRTTSLERDIYADYGASFRSIFGDQPIAHPFLEMKRKRYLGEPQEIIDLLRTCNIDLADKTVLDVSGGPGSFAHLLKDKVKSIAVTEYDQNSVRSMQELLGSDVRVFQSDLNEPWTDTQTFDVALYRSCVYFCNDFGKHLAEISSRLSPNGIILVITNRPTLGNALRWQYEDYTHNVFYSPKALRQAFQTNGFDVAGTGTTDFYTHYLQWYPPRQAVYYLWGLWNLFKPGAPHKLDARSTWMIARKRA